MLTLLLLGLGVGAVLGLTGAGGGILAVPALVFSQGWSVAEAAPVALLAVTGAALVGAVEGLWRGLVRYRAASLMALVGTLTAPLGLAAARVLPARWMLLLFAAAMLVVAVRQLRKAAQDDRSHAPLHINPATGRLIWTPLTVLVLSLIGGFTGFLTGLLGVGGGFVIVPALRRWTDVSVHGIVATSLLVITLVGAGSVVASVRHGHDLPLAVALPFIAAAAIGMLGGRLLVARFHPRHVQSLFALLVILVALGMMVRALH